MIQRRVRLTQYLYFYRFRDTGLIFLGLADTDVFWPAGGIDVDKAFPNIKTGKAKDAAEAKSKSTTKKSKPMKKTKAEGSKEATSPAPAAPAETSTSAETTAPDLKKQPSDSLQSSPAPPSPEPAASTVTRIYAQKGSPLPAPNPEARPKKPTPKERNAPEWAKSPVAAGDFSVGRRPSTVKLADSFEAVGSFPLSPFCLKPKAAILGC
jgi:hypothetical protein